MSRIEVPERQHKMSILGAKSSPQQTLHFGIPQVNREASFLFDTVDYNLQSRFIFGHARGYLQTPSVFPPISIRSHPRLSLPQVSPPVFAAPSIPAFFTSNTNACQHYCFPTVSNSQTQGTAISMFGRSLCIFLPVQQISLTQH